ncbi:MAG: hypothetical protein ACNI28_02870 [Arcobacter sp.]|uniref:hypothetical protein n=1 Tax=Arcobacter sp. TaxID=1872629 RepID=UPI003B005212
MLKKFLINKKRILQKIEDIKYKSDIGQSQYLASVIFKYRDRVISAAAIQALHKIALENDGAAVLMPNYFIDPKSPQSFSLFILDVWGIDGRGTAVSGIVSSGTLGYGNSLIVKKADGRDIYTECLDINLHEETDTISPGDKITIFLKDISMGEVCQGDAIYAKTI